MQNSNTNKTMVKRKVSCVNGAIHDPTQWDEVISGLDEYQFYAYIFHDKDEGKEKHLHFVAWSAPTTMSTHSMRLGIPENMIEITRQRVGSLKYLIHKNNPEKYQYDFNEVFSSDIVKFRSLVLGNTVDSNREFADLVEVYKGQLSPYAYVTKYSDHFTNLPFYSRTRLFGDLIRLNKEGRRDLVKLETDYKFL